jgi:hypothetical protein
MTRPIIAALLTLSVLLPGCTTSNVKYSDLRPPSTATISGDTVTVHLGSDLTNSACWTRVRTKVEGNTIYVFGARTLREQSRQFVVRLPASAPAQTIAVIWVDPDGRHISIPVTR